MISLSKEEAKYLNQEPLYLPSLGWVRDDS
jgi:hypothetical protein